MEGHGAQPPEQGSHNGADKPASAVQLPDHVAAQTGAAVPAITATSAGHVFLEASPPLETATPPQQATAAAPNLASQAQQGLAPAVATAQEEPAPASAANGPATPPRSPFASEGAATPPKSPFESEGIANGSAATGQPGVASDGQHGPGRPNSPGLGSAGSEAPLLGAGCDATAAQDPSAPGPTGGSPRPALKSANSVARQQELEALGSRVVSWHDNLMTVHEYEASEHSDDSDKGSGRRGGCCSIQ